MSWPHWKTYVRDGGGVALFVGPDTDRSFYNDRFYRNGEGLFPVPLKLPTQLMDRAGRRRRPTWK